MFNFPDAMGLTEVLSLAVAAVLVNNYILVQFWAAARSSAFPKRPIRPSAWAWRSCLLWRWRARFLGGMVLHPRPARLWVHADHRIHSGYRDARAVR